MEKDLIMEMIDALIACESKLEGEGNSELVKRVNELLGRASHELNKAISGDSVDTLVERVKADDDVIDEEELESLLRMFGI